LLQLIHESQATIVRSRELVSRLEDLIWAVGGFDRRSR
jgi:hypothetical protein